jgi:hypothetical protein
MKVSKSYLILAILLSLLTFSLFACSLELGGGSSGGATPPPGESLAGHLTATYGAEQFHAQLTAIAEDPLVGGGATP